MKGYAGWSPVFGVALLLCAGALQAAAIDEDEGRIEALIEAEHAATKAAAAAAAALATEPQITVVVPAPVVAQAIAPSPDAISNDDWLASNASPDTRLRFDELAVRIGSKVAIVTVSEHVHRGIVVAADAHGLTLRVPRAGSGGGAVYTLKREQIARIDLR
ncbi:MAG: hypothetical protein ABIW82_09800 [Dokdonella sp.]